MKNNDLFQCFPIRYSPIQDLLKRESGFKLSELLEEEHLVQEIRGYNIPLLEYIGREEIVEQLVGYVVDNFSITDDEAGLYRLYKWDLTFI